MMVITINYHLPVNEQLTNVLIALHPFSHIIHTIILGVWICIYSSLPKEKAAAQKLIRQLV